jgi:Ethylbenzene dehydrogenase
VVPNIDKTGGGIVPILDGDVSDAAWSVSPDVSVLTEEGANFGGSGESRVSIRAVHDALRIYFAITWDDPTRSLKHQPLLKQDDGWHIVRTAALPAGEEQFFEDAFSLLISRPNLPVIGAAIHLSPRPLPDAPAAESGRGLHYTDPGALTDVWVWRADHGGLDGYLEDAHISSPQSATLRQLAGEERYAGGFANDPGPDCYRDNFVETPQGNSLYAATPLRLPVSLSATAAMMGDIHHSGDVSEEQGVKWWMTPADTVPFTRAADSTIPAGTVIPGVLVLCVPSGDLADVAGVARWSAGRWTLELSRLLDTGSVSDVPIETGAMIWLAAFDHAATNHTHHVRPLIVELQ